MTKAEASDPYTVPCFCCGRDLENCFPELAGNQPMEGLEFTTLGYYGSTVFDPMDGSALAINICDPCLISNKNRVLEIVRERKPDEFKYQIWSPDQ